METTKTVEQVAQEINEKLASAASKADLDALKNEISTLKGQGLVSKSDFDKLDADIQKMSETIASLTQKREGNKTTLKAGISAQIDKNKALPNAQKQINLVVKADNLFNIAVIDGGAFDEDEANMDSLLLSESAIETGFAADLRRELTILNEMRNAVPLRIGDALKWVEPEDADGNPLTVKEANEKPVGTVKYRRRSKESTKIAIYFQVTEEFLNRADFLMTLVQTHFRELVTEVLEEVAFGATDGILSYATAFVAPAGYTVPEPTKLDAISAVAVSMKLNRYRPSHVVLNSADIAMMFAAKGLDGQYQLANGMSVRLIDGGQTLVVGTIKLRIIEVNGELLPTGDFVVIDWSKLKFGLGSARLKSDPYTNMRDNILNFLMEAPFCVARPANYPYAVVEAGFTAVITEITPEPEGE